MWLQSSCIARHAMLMPMGRFGSAAGCKDDAHALGKEAVDQDGDEVACVALGYLIISADTCEDNGSDDSNEASIAPLSPMHAHTCVFCLQSMASISTHPCMRMRMMSAILMEATWKFQQFRRHAYFAFCSWCMIWLKFVGHRRRNSLQHLVQPQRDTRIH